MKNYKSSLRMKLKGYTCTVSTHTHTQVLQCGMGVRCSLRLDSSHNISTFCSLLPSSTEITIPGVCVRGKGVRRKEKVEWAVGDVRLTIFISPHSRSPEHINIKNVTIYFLHVRTIYSARQSDSSVTGVCVTVLFV